jgi:hypothetical protein
MSDIVERLRAQEYFDTWNGFITKEAADEIERLRKELAEAKLCSCQKRDKEIEELFEELSK